MGASDATRPILVNDGSAQRPAIEGRQALESAARAYKPATNGTVNLLASCQGQMSVRLKDSLCLKAHTFVLCPNAARKLCGSMASGMAGFAAEGGGERERGWLDKGHLEAICACLLNA